MYPWGYMYPILETPALKDLALQEKEIEIKEKEPSKALLAKKKLYLKRHKQELQLDNLQQITEDLDSFTNEEELNKLSSACESTFGFSKINSTGGL